MTDFSKDSEDYFCRFSFAQFVTLVLLELATLFFVFYLGARYGPELIGDRKGSEADAVDEAGPGPAVNYTYPEVLPDTPARGAIQVKPSGVTAEEVDSRREIPVVPPPRAAEKREEVGGGSYAIQVGAYRAADEAARQVKRWQGRGYSCYMAVGDVPGKGTWYRVRIGSFDGRDEAKGFLEKFRRREKADAFVVSSKS